ncbi:MAG: hypothetical protein GY839_17320 [candidate division Zixibacteria bacterium]|nr:hypothetical protein [candidate division Zixibacteria bacterium]
MIKPISSYEVKMSTHPQFNEWVANILLRKDNAIVVDVRFVENPDLLAQYGSINEDAISFVYIGMNRFTDFHHILQTEKPLFVQLVPASGSNPARILLTTGAEPVGEQEPRSLFRILR